MREDWFFRVGAELEFYLFDSNGDVIADSGQERYPDRPCPLKAEYIDAVLRCGTFEQERGAGQFEIQFPPDGNFEFLANAIIDAKEMIAKNAKREGLIADFSSKPLKDDHGSALHIHLSLYDKVGGNVFARYPEVLGHAAAGLLQEIYVSMPIFAPIAEDYKRFEPKFDAPTKICWGGNNRTVAIRIPDSIPENRRLEHRVPAANANPHEVIREIIRAARLGIENRLSPPEKVYGNAYDEQYRFSSIK